MSINKEEKIENAFEDLVIEENYEIIKEIFSDEYIAHAGRKEYKGHSFIKRYVSQLHKAIPDIQVVDIQFLTAEDNTVAWQRTLSGTNQEEMKGIPSSKKRVEWNEMVVTRFIEGKIVEEWVVSELMGELLLKAPSIRKL